VPGHIVLFLFSQYFRRRAIGLGLGLDALQLLVVTLLQILKLFDLLHAFVKQLSLLEDLGPFLA
jgi:hypothetical protein